jgi:hypothetical protein
MEGKLFDWLLRSLPWAEVSLRVYSGLAARDSDTYQAFDLELIIKGNVRSRLD